jgi:hypothetical protein
MSLPWKMKLKNLNNAWSRTNTYSILNFPFACYSVQPFPNTALSKTQLNEVKYLVSFKASILFPEPLDNLYETLEEAEQACEKHIDKLMQYLFKKMEGYIEI